MRSRCGGAKCVRLSTKPASNTCTRPKIKPSTGSLEQAVAHGDAQPLVLGQRANNDGGPGRIQFPQSGKETPGKLLLICWIAPAINQVWVPNVHIAGQHDADHFARGLLLFSEAQELGGAPLQKNEPCA